METDRQSLTHEEIWAYVVEDADVESVFGKTAKIRVLSHDEFKENYPALFKIWTSRNDYRGRPSTNIRMANRAKKFDAKKLVENLSFKVALALKERFVGLLQAAVEGNTERGAEFLDLSLDANILG